MAWRNPIQLMLDRAQTTVADVRSQLHRDSMVRRAATSDIVLRPRRWRKRPTRWRITADLGALFFLLWIGFVFLLEYQKEEQTGIARLTWLVSAIAAASLIIWPLLFTAATVRLFLTVHHDQACRGYRTRARTRPTEVVQTAGSMIDKVVGRDELCCTLMDDLGERHPQPHVIVGGVGAGKTALLVELTRMLAEKKAVPVNIRLRDADTERDLDFHEMARKRFLGLIDDHLISGGDGDRIWRQLRKDGIVVVLADGLEEALTRGDSAPDVDRYSTIRNAIRKARRDDLPLVVASRPEESLRTMDAVIVDLEPLGDGPALSYVLEGVDDRDTADLVKIVRDAEVADQPLYLRMIRAIYHNAGVEWHELVGRYVAMRADAAEAVVDPYRIRVQIFNSWRSAMIDGHLYEDYGLVRALRIRTFELLSALACAGLVSEFVEDDLDVSFDELIGGRAAPGGDALMLSCRARLIDAVDRTLDREAGDSWRRIDIPESGAREFWQAQLGAVAVMGEQLGLVESKPNAVRFKHGLVKAYLGSRYLSRLPAEVWRRGGRIYANPSRELLIALVMSSRETLSDQVEQAGSSGPVPAVPDGLVGALAEGAERLAQIRSAKSAQMFRTAIEINAVVGAGDVTGLADRLRSRWGAFQSINIVAHDLDEAKRGVLEVLGRAIRSSPRAHGDEA